MASIAAAFADLLVDQNDRRIDEKPVIRRPSLKAIENHLSSEAASNPALLQWQTFRPHDDTPADAMEGMCRGQSHRRNMAGRGAPAVTQASTRLQSRSQAQPIKLKLTAEEKPRARRTADQPLYMGNTVLEGETRPRALRPTSDGLATSPAQWNMVPAVTKVTKLEATAPTVFRERPKKPPVRSRPTAAPPANIGRPVATTTVAPVDSVPASTASFLNLKPVGTIDVRSAGKAESSFYVSHFMAEAALEMLKNNAINAEDVQKDQEIWRIDGGI